MARGKKKETVLTPEEKLAQAWVPTEEQPYNVPSNWCWVRLGALGYTNIGLTYRPADINDVGTIVLRSSNIQNGKMDYSDVVRVSMDIPESKMSQKGDILICARNGSKSLVGKTAIIDSDGMSYGAFMAIFRSPFNPLIFYFLNSHYFRSIIDRDVGTSTINQVTQALIKELPFPLPPLAEQQRIADRIESLFAKLDEAKEKAQSVLDSFETRKAAILHKAFNGELTAKWREVHGKGLSEWSCSYLKECCQIGSGGTPSRKNPEYYQGSIPWIKTGEINWNEIDDAEEKISEAAIENSSAKLYEPGAILVAMYGMGVTRGRAAILRVPAATNQAVCVLQPKDDLLNKYLFYYFMCNYWDIREQAVGGNQLNLSGTIIGKFQISIPSVEEQIEIIRILDSLFAKEQQAKEASEVVLEKIDLLKKSTLARAFRGELGTNDPTEESALELLKQVLR